MSNRPPNSDSQNTSFEELASLSIDEVNSVTPDLNYDPDNGDYTLQISSLNSTGDFAVTRNTGWNNI